MPLFKPVSHYEQERYGRSFRITESLNFEGVNADNADTIASQTEQEIYDTMTDLKAVIVPKFVSGQLDAEEFKKEMAKIVELGTKLIYVKQLKK